jgi:metal-sulfur cluster biosynthetic enzyme
MTSLEKPAARNQPVWVSETTYPELVQRLREQLTEIVDPEIGLNIIQLGLVRDVDILNDSAKVTMILTTPFCPYGPAMLETTRQKAEQALERPTTLEFGTEMWDFSMIDEEAATEWGLF